MATRIRTVTGRKPILGTILCRVLTRLAVVAALGAAPAADLASWAADPPGANAPSGPNVPPGGTPPSTLAIVGVTLVDAAHRLPRPHHTVVIRGERIVAVGPTPDVNVPPGSRVLNGQGKYLIPGLWDMHCHVESETFLYLYVGNGVTGVRHMYSGSPLQPPVAQWGREAAAGRRIGPRIVATTKVIDGLNGDKPTVPHSTIVARTPEEGRAAVRQVRANGDEFVKVYPFLLPEVFAAIVEEAARGPKPLPVAGHVPHLIGAAAASDMGLKSIEHAHGLFLACSKDEATLRKQLAAMIKNGALADDTLNATSGWRMEVKAMDSYDADKAAALFRKLVANGTWVVPTLVCRRNWASLHDERFLTDPRKQYLPVSVRTTWFHTVRAGHVRFPLFGNIELAPQDIENMKRLLAGHLQLVRAMHEAGVKMMAGTDSPVPYCFPGSGLLDELELLVQAGLTPRDALRMATLRPAEFLDRLDDFGSIDKGKYADLVLLGANPLTDIRHLRQIEGVFVAGRYYDRDAVRQLATGRRPEPR